MLDVQRFVEIENRDTKLHLRMIEEGKVHRDREQRDRQYDRDNGRVSDHRPAGGRGVARLAPTYKEWCARGWIRIRRWRIVGNYTVHGWFIVSGGYRSMADKGGDCAPGTDLRLRVRRLGLKIGGNSHRGARESTKRIHCKECG